MAGGVVVRSGSRRARSSAAAGSARRTSAVPGKRVRRLNMSPVRRPWRARGCHEVASKSLDGIPGPESSFCMAELLLSCQDLAQAYGAAPVFAGLAFGISEGDHVGLVGPNGSGKSTLLRILAGLEAPSAGTRAARKRLRLGYVPQDPRFPEGATVDSVLRAAAREAAAGDHEDEARVAVALGRAGFADPRQPAATLSGGWQKRLAIARELARGPELLLL